MVPLGLGLFTAGTAGLGWVLWQWLSCSDGGTCPQFHKTLGNIIFIVAPVLMVGGVSLVAIGLGRIVRGRVARRRGLPE